MSEEEIMTETEQTKEPQTFTVDQVKEMIRQAQANQQRWIFLDLAFRECLNHMRPLCTATKDYPIPAYDSQVYAELDALFDRVRTQYLGTGDPANETEQD